MNTSPWSWATVHTPSSSAERASDLPLPVAPLAARGASALIFLVNSATDIGVAFVSSSGRTYATGTAKLRFCAPSAMTPALVMPITRPSRLNSGPPELPGEIGTLIWTRR